MNQFPIETLLELQGIVFPLIKTFGGPDVADAFLKPGGEKVREGGAVLHEIADVLVAAGEALADGRLEMDEVDEVIAEALEAKLAAQKLFGHPDGTE